jgi:hypothetical protein
VGRATRSRPRLPIAFGSYSDNSCPNVVTELSNPSANSAENRLAGQLAAAELSVESGASQCAKVDAISSANGLLTIIGYNPADSSMSMTGSSSSSRARFSAPAATLDGHNNGHVC